MQFTSSFFASYSLPLKWGHRILQRVGALMVHKQGHRYTSSNGRREIKEKDGMKNERTKEKFVPIDLAIAKHPFSVKYFVRFRLFFAIFYEESSIHTGSMVVFLPLYCKVKYDLNDTADSIWQKRN